MNEEEIGREHREGAFQGAEARLLLQTMYNLNKVLS